MENEEILISVKTAQSCLDTMIEYIRRGEYEKASVFAMRANFAMNEIKMKLIVDLARLAAEEATQKGLDQ